ASSIIHMVLKYHVSDYRQLPEEDKLLAALRPAGLAPGLYHFPYCSHKDMNSPAMQEKFKQGPVGFLTLYPNGPVAMPKFLGMWFAYCLLIGVFVAYLTGRTVMPSAPYLAVFRVAGTAEDSQIGRAWHHCASCEIGNEDADQQAIGEPHAKKLGHGDRAIGVQGQKSDRPLLELFLHSGRIHVLMGAIREMIEARGQTSRPQGGKKLVLLGKLPIVANVILQHHVDDRAGHEHDYRRKQNGQQKRGERNHALPPWKYI